MKTIIEEKGTLQSEQYDDTDTSSEDSSVSSDDSAVEQIGNALAAILHNFPQQECNEEGLVNITNWLEVFGLAPIFELLKEIGGCNDDREDISELQKWVEKLPWNVHEMAFGSLRQIYRTSGTDGVTLEDVQALLQPVYFEGVEEVLNPTARVGASDSRQGLYLITRIPPEDPSGSLCLLRPNVRDSLATIQNLHGLPSQPPYVIRPSPPKGMGMFASRRINDGELVLCERPMVVLPDMLLFLDRHINRNPDPNQILEDYRESILQAILQNDTQRKTSFKSLYRCKETTNMLNDIFQTNAILLTGLVDPDRARVSKAGSGHGGVFENVSRINHSCEPNVRLEFDYDTFAVEVRALRDVGEGEELMFAYAGVGIDDADERRLILKAYWGFTCHCNRCAPLHLDS